MEEEGGWDRLKQYETAVCPSHIVGLMDRVGSKYHKFKLGVVVLHS